MLLCVYMCVCVWMHREETEKRYMKYLALIIFCEGRKTGRRVTGGVLSFLNIRYGLNIL